ncbi:MAG TPA: ABC transporter permease, partial [Bryobacteraceae bacterium]
MFRKTFTRLTHLFAYLFHRREVENGLDDELRSSFEMMAERRIAQGLSPDEARRLTRMEFEGLDQLKERVRDGMAGAGVQTMFRDARYAWQGVRRHKSFTFISVLMLALGIGATTAIFSIFYAVLLHPLPYDKPEGLAVVWANLRSAGTVRAPVSGAIVRELQNHSRSFSGVAGIWTITRTIRGDNPEQVKAAMVTVNFFDVLGVRAQRGHTFEKSEEGGPAIVLTDGLFGRRFAGDWSLMGKALPLQGGSNTLVGVLPANFQLHFAPDANVPRDIQIFDTFPADVYSGRDQYFIRVICRLKPGISMAEAQHDADRVAKEIRAKYAEYDRDDLQFTITGMQADAVRDVKPALDALFAGAVLVLLICCVNVAGLLVARAGDRRKEMALRLALGASRGRILHQLFVESAVLCAFGGVLGAALGWAGFRGLLAIRPERLSNIGDARLSWPVLALAAVSSLSAALLFGLAPALESFRMDIVATLRARDRSWIVRLHRRSGNLLVIGEVTLAFVLVTGAALTARTLSRLQQARPGFEPRSLLTFQIGGMKTNEIAGWESRLATLPGVEFVGATSHLPLDTDIPNWYSPYEPEPMTENHGATFISDLRCVTPGYFAAMGARLIAGRYFDRQDRANSRQVLIVDDLLARTTWPGQSAMGKKIRAEHVTRNGFEPISGVVVGVIQHLYNHSLAKAVRGQIYMPFEQSPRSPLTFVLRTRVPPLSLAPPIRRMLHDTTPFAAMAKIRPMTEYVAREIAPSGFTAVLAAIFAGLALLLAVTGIYGVLNYQISQRMPEMGIRMALGASAREVVRLVFKETLVLVGTGLLLGAAGALLVARWLAAFLYGVSPRDPMSFALALLLLPAAAFLGSLLPV